MSASVKLTSAVALAACLAAGAYAQSDAATQYLVKSMRTAFGVNITAIMLQRDPSSEGSFQRVKVERGKDGSSRCTILQPLRFQGYTLVDDGVRQRTYMPDDNLILDQESPNKAPHEADQKLKLAKKNYSFRMAQSEVIAGRQTVCVIATPKSETMDLRKYYLDASTCYPLRLETVNDGDDVTLVYDTKIIEFPKDIDKQVFTIRSVGARTLQYKLVNIVSAEQARPIVGFGPLVPTTLPLGFQVQGVQFSDGGENKSIVVRMSDGLARATVYESKAGVKMNSPENSTVREVNGVRLMLVSDLTKKIREQLLDSFIQQALTEPAIRPQRLYGSGFTIFSGLPTCVELYPPVSVLLRTESQQPTFSVGCNSPSVDLSV